MTTDLIMLTASAVLTGALVLPYGLAMWALWPVREVLGNRDAPPPLPPWAERARRAQRNMLENFPHFAALVLVANVAAWPTTKPASAPRCSSGRAWCTPSSTSRGSGGCGHPRTSLAW